MSRSKKRLNIVVMLAALALVAVVAVAGCAPQQQAADSSSTGGDDATTTQTAEAGAYVSDEQCMSCHGGSYEAVAELTADLGDWNPHNSMHGGYNSCVNCHAKDKEVTYNYCTQCHVYAPDEEVLY